MEILRPEFHSLIPTFRPLSLIQSNNITLLALLQIANYNVANKEKLTKGIPEDELEDYTRTGDTYGYNVSEHSVTTEDGYILKLYNIMNPKCETYIKPPVLLMHGLLLSSDSWLDAGPNVSLAYLIADNCYDLWVGNVRGNYLGREHIHLDPDVDKEFWDFTNDEMGLYDAPALIDCVLDKTESAKLNYIGYSQGGGMFAIMCSERPDYVNKVSTFIGLAPALRLTNTKSVSFRSVAESSELLSELGLVELFFKGSALQEFGESYCQKEASYPTCISILNLIDSFHPGSITERTIKRLYVHFPAGTSVKNFQKYAQDLHTDKFQKYDYGKEKNLKLYGKETPPEYDLSKMTIPVLLIPGLNDKLVDVKDVMWAHKQLPNSILKIVNDPLWDHFDVIYSELISTLLFPEIHKHLIKYSDDVKESNAPTSNSIAAIPSLNLI